MKINPVVGYVGGKRRMLGRLRPFFDPREIVHYVEPFVGMGAVYLDLRARGFSGRATLADSNSCVRDFWTIVHGDAAPLVDASKQLSHWPTTEEGFWAMMAEPCEDKAERTARFLWLTNFMYANLPPSYVEGKWVAAGYYTCQTQIPTLVE